MRCLLDTHTLIWWWLGDPSLSSNARDAICDERNRIFSSPVNAFEIANKVRRGLLPELGEIIATFDDVVASDGFLTLPIIARHARDAGLLAGRHRDPFDRLIAAQALTEDLTVITRDPEIAAFGCKVLW